MRYKFNKINRKSKHTHQQLHDMRDAVLEAAEKDLALKKKIWDTELNRALKECKAGNGKL